MKQFAFGKQTANLNFGRTYTQEHGWHHTDKFGWNQVVLAGDIRNNIFGGKVCTISDTPQNARIHITHRHIHLRKVGGERDFLVEHSEWEFF